MAAPTARPSSGAAGARGNRAAPSADQAATQPAAAGARVTGRGRAGRSALPLPSDPSMLAATNNPSSQPDEAYYIEEILAAILLCCAAVLYLGRLCMKARGRGGTQTSHWEQPIHSADADVHFAAAIDVRLPLAVNEHEPLAVAHHQHETVTLTKSRNMTASQRATEHAQLPDPDKFLAALDKLPRARAHVQRRRDTMQQRARVNASRAAAVPFASSQRGLWK